jgi:RNA polymerase sigma factor (TIGR02999 family)
MYFYPAAMDPLSSDITGLLANWHRGDRTALERLLPLIRAQVHRIARRQLSRGTGQTMHPSSLVQEALVRLLPNRGGEWQDREHFYAVTSQVMRHVLVDHARRHARAKRGSNAPHVGIDDAAILSPEQVDEVVAIDLALQRLAALDARKSQVFEMRFFGGLTLEETAEALGVTTRTVLRDWRFARAWLRRELSGGRVSHDGAVSTD